MSEVALLRWRGGDVVRHVSGRTIPDESERAGQLRSLGS